MAQPSDVNSLEDSDATQLEGDSPPTESQLTATEWAQVVRFDDGRDDQRRVYVTAESCTETTCVITRDGAIRIDPSGRRLRLALWLMHERTLTRIDYFEKRSPRDYVLAERIFRRRPNRRLWSITRRLEQGELDTLYIYGVSLQYSLDEGDPLILEVTELDNPGSQRIYFFRYHRAGFRLSFDLGLVFPINALNVPTPDPPWRSRRVNAAVTLALRRALDPAVEYSWLEKIFYSGHPTLFLGPLSRRLELPGEIPEDQTDLFVGVGITYFDFLFFGWGANVFTEPRTSGPFIGIHLRKAIQFVSGVNRSRPDKWDEYMKKERQKEIVE